MAAKKILKWTGITLGVLVGILLIWTAIVIVFGIQIDLAPFRAPVEAAASRALGREVRIEGSAHLRPTALPLIEVEGVSVANLEGWEPRDFALLDLARLELAFLPLLRGEISIGEITVEGLTLNLESNAEGRKNWQFRAVEAGAEAEAAPEEPQAPVEQEEQEETIPEEVEAEAETRIEFVQLEEMAIRDIAVNYRDGGLQRSYEFRLDELQGKAPGGLPMRATLRGSYQDQPFSFSLDGASFAEFMDPAQPWNLVLEGDIVDTPVRISGTAYPQGEATGAELDVELGGVDIGGLLAWFGVVDDLDVAVDRMSVNVAARGDNLFELLDESDFRFALEGGRWILRDLSGKASAEIRIRDGEIAASAGEPLTLVVNGQLDQTPVKIEIRSAPLVSFVAPPDRVPVSIIAAAAGARMELNLQAALPLGSKDAELSMAFSGERLDSLDELLRTSFPPLGPYSIGGSVSYTDTAYRLSDFQVRVGSSDLQGDFSLDTAGERPRVDVSLTTNTLQLDDFDAGDWSPEGEAGAEQADAAEPASQEAEATEQRREARKAFLSREVLQSFDAALDVTVNQVLSGKDELGSGTLNVTVESGRFSISQLELNIPGGSMQATFGYEPGDNQAQIETSAQIERFDYGVLARRINPETEMGGLLSLDLEISTLAKSLRGIFHSAEGHLGFGVWPDEFEADVIDLWAVNLMSALMPKLDDEPASVVNCGIGWFTLEDGMLSEDRVLVDTTRMQVTGDVDVNFKAEEVHMILASRAKKAQFFSLETPIEVQGKFTDFGVGAKSGAIFGTSVKFITSPITVPFRRMFSKAVPKDGVEACALAWEGSDEEADAESSD